MEDSLPDRVEDDVPALDETGLDLRVLSQSPSLDVQAEYITD